MNSSDRQLCPDGGCIGVIGPDGHCKECGLSASADPEDLEAEDEDLEDEDEDEDEDWDDDEGDEDLDDDELDRDEDEDIDDEDLEDEEDLDDEDEDEDGEEDENGDDDWDSTWDEDEDEDEDDEDTEDAEDALLGAGFDAPHRELCPDGGCIGVIGADGLCRECGTPGRSARLDPRQRAMKTDDEMEHDEEDGDDLDIAVSTPLPADHDFKSRRLCPDGACIGIIGRDGSCRECGKRP